VVCLPLWKIWFRQLGWFFPIYGKITNVPNHQTEINWNRLNPLHQLHHSKCQCYWFEPLNSRNTTRPPPPFFHRQIVRSLHVSWFIRLSALRFIKPLHSLNDPSLKYYIIQIAKQKTKNHSRSLSVYCINHGQSYMPCKKKKILSWWR